MGARRLEAHPALSTGGNYVNFQTADEDDDRVRATYGAQFDRLVEIKTRFDPRNVFRSNRNIRPGRHGIGSPGGEP